MKEDNKKYWEILGFANSFTDKFIDTWKKIQNSLEKKETDTNFNFFSNFNVRERISTLFDYLIPSFIPDSPLFDNEFEVEDFFGSQRGGTKFIGQYSAEDIELLIRNSSLGNRLQEIGINDWYIEFDLSDCFSHFGYLRSKSLIEKEKYIGFLIIQIGEFKLKETIDLSPGFKVLKENFPKSLNLLNVRWFSLQNPLSNFSINKPRLPGQRFPGTGLAKDAFELLCNAAIKANRDGIINTPEHFHNAYLYEGFYFINPEEEGEFRKLKFNLKNDIKEKGLASVSWAIYLGFLRCNNQIINWEGRNQAFPLSKKLKSYFESIEYKNLTESSFNNTGNFYIEWKDAESFIIKTLLDFNE